MMFIAYHKFQSCRLPILKGFRRCSKPRRRLPRSCRRLDSVRVSTYKMGSSNLEHLRTWDADEPLAGDIDRVQKLKDARSEAAKEIEAYKAKKEEEFKRFKSEVS